MTKREHGISAGQVSAALERDQREERADEDTALRRDQDLSDRLAAELARHRSAEPPAGD